MDKRQGKEFELETLEERILLSGDPLLDPLQALGPQQKDPTLENLSSPYGIVNASTIEKFDQSADGQHSGTGSSSSENGHSHKLSYDPQAMLDDLFDGMLEEDFDDESNPPAAVEMAEQTAVETETEQNSSEQILVALTLDGTLHSAEAGSLAEEIETDNEQKNISVYDYFGYSAPPVEPSQTLENLQISLVPSLASNPVADTLWLENDLILANGSNPENIKTLIVSDGYTLSGSGSVDFGIINQGTFKPGNSPGILTPPTFTNGSGATMVVEIGGTTPGPGTPIDTAMIRLIQPVPAQDLFPWMGRLRFSSSIVLSPRSGKLLKY